MNSALVSGFCRCFRLFRVQALHFFLQPTLLCMVLAPGVAQCVQARTLPAQVG